MQEQLQIRVVELVTDLDQRIPVHYLKHWIRTYQTIHDSLVVPRLDYYFLQRMKLGDISHEAVRQLYGVVQNIRG